MLAYQYFCQQTTFSLRNNLVCETNTQLIMLLIKITEKVKQGCVARKFASGVFLDLERPSTQ